MLVRVSSLARAQEMAADWADKAVSLLEPGVDAPTFEVPHLLVRMQDTEIITDPWSPKRQDIEEVLAFPGKDDKVLVHCQAGISRSTAMAIALLVRDGKSPAEAVSAVHQDSPNMWPNKLILRHADDILLMQGTLIQGVQEALKTLDREVILWCYQCQKFFRDGDGCGGGHWV